MPTTPVPAAEVRQATRDVLASGRYDEAEPTLIDRLGSLVGDLLGRLLFLVEEGGAAGPLGLLGLALAVLVIAVLLGRGVARVRRSAPRAVDPVVGVAGRSAEDWRADAERAAAAGDHRAAVRGHYRALIAALAADGLLEELPGRTAGEYRRALAQHLPAAAPAFGEATVLFERAWYGTMPMGPGETDRLRDLSAQVGAVVRNPAQHVPAGQPA